MLCLPPEVEEGNIEYKLKLINPSHSRFEHLVTQMKWRLQEGNGEALYEIGVQDNGLLIGLSPSDLALSMETLTNMATRLGAELTVLREHPVSEAKRVAEVLVRLVPEDQQFIDIRVAMLGNAEAGKSTLLGVLTYGELDNGRGEARLNLFRHLHEIQSGRTSSVSDEILGFDSNGRVVNYQRRTMAEVCEAASKLITFIDLAGHPKYVKTTLSGLTGHVPEFVLLVVSAAQGCIGTTQEHLGFALALHLPVFCVVTKTDQVSSADLQRTLEQLEMTLKSSGCSRVPMRVESEDDAILAATRMAQSQLIVPVFAVSNVTGASLDLLQRFLYLLPPTSVAKDDEEELNLPTQFRVDEVFKVPDVGVVVSGFLQHGTIKAGQHLLLGPSEANQYSEVIVDSVHRNRRPTRVLLPGSVASLALKCATASHRHSPSASRISPRKGAVLVDPETSPAQHTCLAFDADLYVLSHAASGVGVGFQCTVYLGSIRQTAVVEAINGAMTSQASSTIRANETARVRLRFICQPEYVVVGSRLLIREAACKAIGRVTAVAPFGGEPRHSAKRRRRVSERRRSLSGSSASQRRTTHHRTMTKSCSHYPDVTRVTSPTAPPSLPAFTEDAPPNRD